MSVLDNKCPGCGAKIDFNPVNQLWDCQYCGSKFTLEEMQKHDNASNVSVNVVEQVMPEETMNNIDIYHCKNCGAEIMADETTTSTFCVYCGSTAILKDKIEQGRAPNYIIPFKKVREDAVEAFKKITRFKPLMPKCFKEVRNIEKISGVYIPFWAYDLEANGEIEFEARDVTTWSDSRYRYTKVDKYAVRKSGHFDFNKVLADASSRFSDELMDSIEPFNYDDLKAYNHAYLSGFLAEKYDVKESEGLDRAIERTNNTCVGLVANTVGHMQKSVAYNGMLVNAKKIHYIMLPVWMVNINYNNKMYTFAMNGQTGKIVGNIPIGIKETIIWSVLVFIVLFALGLGFVWFM